MFRGVSLTTLLLVAVATAACLGLGDCGDDGTSDSIRLTCQASVSGGRVPFEVQFTAQAEDAGQVDYIWDFGDGTRGAGQAISKVYVRGGAYTAVVVARRGTFEASCSQQIAADAAARIETCTAEPDSGAAPLPVGFHSQVTNFSADPVTYTWDFGDGGASSDPNPHYTYRRLGAYRARLTVRSNGASSECVVPITVQGAVNVTCGIAPYTGTAPLRVEHNADVVGETGCQYTWDFGDGSAVVNEKWTAHEYLVGNTFYPTVTVQCGALQGVCSQKLEVKPPTSPTPWPDSHPTPPDPRL